MLKKIMLIILPSILFSSCTIVGHYYLINSSDRKVNVNIKVKPVYMTYLSSNQIVNVKSSKYDNKKVKFSAYKKMQTHFFTMDTLANTFSFELESKHIAHLGSNFNGREIGEIEIVDNDDIQPFDANQGKFRSRGLMKYVMLYEYE